MSLFDEYPDLGNCEHLKGEPARIIKSNGDSLAFTRCIDCDRPVHPGVWLKHDDRELMNYATVDELPVWRDDRENVPPCERCGALGAELHHWHPKALEGGHEANEWPTSWLCRSCHQLWHLRVVRAVLRGDLR